MSKTLLELLQQNQSEPMSAAEAATVERADKLIVYLHAEFKQDAESMRAACLVALANATIHRDRAAGKDRKASRAALLEELGLTFDESVRALGSHAIERLLSGIFEALNPKGASL